MLSRKTRLKRILPSFLSTLMIACAGPAQSRNPYPDDTILEERFRLLEADFNRLALMFKEDKTLISVNDEAAWLDYGVKADIPQQRLDEYRSLFKKLGVKHIGRGEKSGDFYLPVWQRDGGSFGKGAAKYYVFADTAPEPLTDSLDKAYSETSRGHDAFGYKRVSGNWYLHLTVG